MSEFIITLEFQGKQYAFRMSFDDRDMADHQFTEGNYGCDCNKSLFIQRYCDSEFFSMECGTSIKLISIQEVSSGNTIVYC